MFKYKIRHTNVCCISICITLQLLIITRKDISSYIIHGIYHHISYMVYTIIYHTWYIPSCIIYHHISYMVYIIYGISSYMVYHHISYISSYIIHGISSYMEYYHISHISSYIIYGISIDDWNHLKTMCVYNYICIHTDISRKTHCKKRTKNKQTTNQTIKQHCLLHTYVQYTIYLHIYIIH